MKNLIFDVGGVQVWPRLGNWHIPYRAAEILGERADTLESERFSDAWSQAYHWLDEGQLVPGTEDERRLRRGWVEEINGLMGWAMTPAEITAMTDDFTDDIDRYGFFDDALPWLRRWKGVYGLGVLSDAMPSIIDFLNAYGSGPLFEHIVISTHVGATKPDGRMFRAAIEAFHAQPGDCLFVDDNPANVRAALAAGMKGVQMARDEFMPPRLWDGPVVRNFEELNRLLESGAIF